MEKTFEDYDALCESLEGIENNDPGWLPSKEEIESIATADPEKYIDFFIWLSITGTAPDTQEHAASKALINKFLRENLRLV